MKRSWIAAAFALALAAAAAVAADPQLDAQRFDYGLRARQLASGVYVVEGANADFEPRNGCNIINTGFIATGAGVVVINTGPSRRYGEQLRALIGRTTREPVVQVIHLNLHPDYFLGNQAFADVPLRATEATRAGMAREAKAYEDNLYRVCGDWLLGTEAQLPTQPIAPGVLRVGSREFELREFSGHTASDLVLIDRASGIVFVGGLAFADRVPTTPHADVPLWQTSLRALAAAPVRTLVPSHGPVRADSSAIAQTQRYLQWLDSHFRRAAEQGLDINELLRREVPAEFRAWAAFATEYPRNVAQMYPAYERAALWPAR